MCRRWKAEARLDGQGPQSCKDLRLCIGPLGLKACPTCGGMPHLIPPHVGVGDAGTGPLVSLPMTYASLISA